MTVALCFRRFLADYARNPVNLLMLVLVPIVFVAVAAPSMADAAALFGGAGGGPPVETTTAGWAAGFLAGIAMYFQVAAARRTDRRLVLAGLGPARLVTARLLTGFVLVLLLSVISFVTLAVRSTVDSPVRVAVGILMFATVYLGLGAIVGAFVPNPVNGTVLILFVLILDVFFGPTMIPDGGGFTRVMPTHFISLWMVDVPSGHPGQLGDFGWGLAWMVGSLAVAFWVLTRTARVARGRSRPQTANERHRVRSRLGIVVGLGLRDWSRNPIFWVLLVVVPAVFILLSDVITPSNLVPMDVVENGRQTTELVDIATIHAGIMAPMAIGALAMLAGVFIVLDAANADQRLHIAGISTAVMLVARLAVVAIAVVVSTSVALAITAIVFTPKQWIAYAAANLLIATTFGLLGVVVGPIFGRVSGAFIAFAVPFLDIGVVQSPMLGTPPDWARYLPGYPGTQTLVDASVTTGFDQTIAVVSALGWIALFALGAILVFRRMITRPARPSLAMA